MILTDKNVLVQLSSGDLGILRQDEVEVIIEEMNDSIDSVWELRCGGFMI